MKKLLFEDALILRTAKAARFLVHHLPLGLSLCFGRVIGAAVYCFTKRRKIAYKNLRAAFAAEKPRPQLRRIAFRSIQNLVVSMVEFLRIPDMDAGDLRRHLTVIGREKYEPRLREGKGIIFLAAHFGNWELMNVSGSMLGYPMLALARVQKHPRSDAFLNSLRTSKGGQVVKKGMSVREILRALHKGAVLGILSDQDGGRQGTFVKFFNRLSSSPSGAATFALRTGVPIFPVFMFREKDGFHHVEVEGPLAVPDTSLSAEARETILLQQFADILESKIRKSPDQWLWAHRRWKSTPDRSVLILSDGRAGHLNQSLAVGEALRAERLRQGFGPDSFHTKIISIRFRRAFMKNLLTALCFVCRGHLPLKPLLLKAVLEKACYDEVMKTYADIVISCGAGLLAVNLLVKDENQARSVAVMKPYFSAACFDAVIVPRHDRMRPGANVFITEGTLSPITRERLGIEAQQLLKEFQVAADTRKIGLLVGGDTDRARFDESRFRGFLLEISRYAQDTRSVLLATSSRRTPRWADELLKETFKSRSQCPLLVIPNEANREGVVSGILGLSDILLVSGESLSMVSEAVSSGKPVVVFMPCDSRKLKSKYRSYLDRLLDQERVVRATPDNLYETIERQAARKNGSPADIPAADAEVLRRAVRKVLG